MMGLPVIWRRPGARVGTTGLVGAWRQAGRQALHVVGGVASRWTPDWRQLWLEASHA